MSEIKQFQVDLNTEIVSEAQSIIKETGEKLSPVINKLLTDWVEEQLLNKEKKLEGKSEKLKEDSKPKAKIDNVENEAMAATGIAEVAESATEFFD